MDIWYNIVYFCTKQILSSPMPSFSGVAVSACFGLRKPSNLQAKYVKDDTVCKMIKMNQDEEVRHTSKHQVQQNQIASQNHGWLGWSPGGPGALVFAAEFTPHLRIAIQLQKVEFLRRQNKSREAGLQEPSRNTRNCLEIDHLTPAAPSKKGSC